MRGHRTARVGSLIEHAPVTTRPEVHLSGGNLFMLTVVRPAWAYRVELVANPWSQNGRSGVAYRATAIEPVVPERKAS